MIQSNSICVSQEGPANALALNKDCTQVVIAGRNVFKVFGIGETEFTEVCNLRVGKNLNLNFSSIDVAWSSIEENTLATAATNGAVVVWNLGRSGRSKQEHVFSDHKRTVNKVSFHLTDPALLISGSQDGMMKCFDLRMKEVARTFISNTESIRDVQFSPHPSQLHFFAAVSENGSVQVWDVRRHERCLHHFTAHSGPVFACDWHPELPWLATASRDKTIKVWDMHGKPNLEHTIYTIASVGHVKWRPQKKYHVSSCALVLDCAVHVWDVRRSHVPLATFPEHRDVTTGVAWQGPGAVLATSRDRALTRRTWPEAAHPLLWASPHAAALSARGHLAHAAPDRPLPRLPTHRPHHHQHDKHLPPTGRKQPTAGSLTAASQAQLERLFPLAAASSLTARAPPAPALVRCALQYRMRNAAPHHLAEHNAQVARDNDRHMVSHVWEVVSAVYAARAADVRRARAPPPPAAPPPPRDPPPPPQPYCAMEEEPLEEAEGGEWAESQFHNSGVLGLPTHSIYVPPPKYAKRLADDESAGWISAASAHYVDEAAADWALPEEAFPLRSTPPAPVHPHPGPHPHTPPPHDDAELIAAADGAPASPGGSSPGGTSASGSSDPHHHHEPAANKAYIHQTSVTTLEDMECEGGGSLLVRGGAGAGGRPALDVTPLLARALRHHAALGDVQTPAVVMIVLQEHRSDLFPYIEESLQEQWLLGYIELLQRHKLWNVATEVISCAWVSSVWCVSQQSTVVVTACGRCGRRARPHAACDRCPPRHMPDLCAVCHQVVRGLYAWCQGCSHGGHLHHMQTWMQKYQLCPAGCGHQCQLG